MQTLILGKSIQEANAYAKKAGLPRFSYRAVRSAGAIKGVRAAEVHILPTFATRPDRHRILAVLQYAKTLEVFYVDPADLPEPPDPRGELTERQLAVAFRYNALRDAAIRADLVAQLQESQRKLDALDRLADDPKVSEAVAARVAHNQVMIEKLEETSGAKAGETEQGEDAAPAAPKRRRSKCSDCQQLHFRDEACPSTVTVTPAVPSTSGASFFG